MGTVYCGILVITVLSIWAAHSYHLFVLFENVRFFSHLADFEREMAYRTEMGLYFYYYKALVFSPSYADGINTLLNDNLTEYGHTINTLQRFNLYPEVIVSFGYRIFKRLAKELDWKDQECWQINRGPKQPPVESCEGIGILSQICITELVLLYIGNYHYFYIYSVFLLAGSVAASIFALGLILSKNYFGGILSVLAFFYNHGEATRVQWTPPLRESFAYPVLAAEMVIITLLLKKRTSGRWIILTFLIVLSCQFWQFSQFVLFSHLASLIFVYSLEYIDRSQMVYFLTSFSVSFIISSFFLFINQMFLNSLYASSLIAISVLLAIRPVLNRIVIRPVFIFMHLFLFLFISIGFKIFVQNFFSLSEDSHISDILLAKFFNFHTFHTRLYTCAPEFDFMAYETVEKLTSTWLLPTASICLVTVLIKIYKTDLTGRKWLYRDRNSDVLRIDSPEMVYNITQLICFASIAFLIMRLKLFLTPQLCIICSLIMRKELIRPFDVRFAKFRWVLMIVVVAGMSQQGVQNLQEEWKIRGEYSNPAQERLFEWIKHSTEQNSVFGGSMAVMANVKLSTERPIVNHPHYESEIIRNRTLRVYSIYSRKPLKEVYTVLKKMNINYYIFQPEFCIHVHPKPECSYLAMWNLEDPSNANRPSLCHQIWDAIQTQNGQLVHPFRVDYTDELYPLSYVVLSLA